MLILSVFAIAAGSTAHPTTSPASWFSVMLISRAISGADDYKQTTPSRVPRQATIAEVIPPQATHAYRITISCRAQSSGELYNCRPRTSWPDSPSTFRSAKALIPQFRLKKSDVLWAISHSARVEISMYLDDPHRKLDHSYPPTWPAPVPDPGLPTIMTSRRY